MSDVHHKQATFHSATKKTTRSTTISVTAMKTLKPSSTTILDKLNPSNVIRILAPSLQFHFGSAISSSTIFQPHQ